MADETIDERVEMPDPGQRRVAARAKSTQAEAEGDADDPEEQARALLAESDARTEDPAARDLEDERVDRRTSDEATPPTDT
ncbi:MAG: hypothetical protein ABR548_06255 [Actinomycetota bacterium]|nr:hypothetical protein [Actinomycetota bacterium]